MFGAHGISLTEHREDSNPNCEVCMLIFSLRPRVPWCSKFHEERFQGYKLVAFDSAILMRFHKQRNYKKLRSSVAIAVCGSIRHRGIEPLEQAIDRGVICPTEVFTPRFKISQHIHKGQRETLMYWGRKLSTEGVDYGVVRKWIQECEQSEHGSHPLCKQSPRELNVSPLVYVIDCITRTVIPLPDGMRYLALSYVWGQTDQGNTSSDIIPRPAPKTIEDAIHVVKELGERYLWVDRFCIPNDAMKHLQIQNMNRIYEQAVVTLAAVSSKDSCSGLAGVSQLRATPQPSARVPKSKNILSFGKVRKRTEREYLTIISTMRHMNYHISSSVWATRGWTYQEAFLSRRCLFFTSEQVFFACRSLVHNETVAYTSVLSSERQVRKLEPNFFSHSPSSDFATRQYGPSRPAHNWNPDSIEASIAEHIQQYSARKLSYESDGLNAFRGILASLPVPSYFGVPCLAPPQVGGPPRAYSIDLDLRFCTGLLWRALDNAGDRQRRENFPTWCWASMRCGVGYGFIEMNWGREGGTHRATVWIEGGSGERVTLDGAFFEAERLGNNVIRELSPCLFIEALAGEFRLSDGSDDNYSYTVLNDIYRIMPASNNSLDSSDVLEESGPEGADWSRDLLHGDWALFDTDQPQIGQSTFDAKVWTVIFLRTFETAYFGLYTRGHGLLLDFEGDTAVRVGVASVRLKPPKKALKLQKRTIRIR